MVREDHSEEGTHEQRLEYWDGARQAKTRGRQLQAKGTASAKALWWEGKKRKPVLLTWTEYREEVCDEAG